MHYRSNPSHRPLADRRHRPCSAPRTGASWCAVTAALTVIASLVVIANSAVAITTATAPATPAAPAAPHPRDGAIHDADTREWWHTTEALSNDAMAGRDTGSADYRRAADYVAGRFKAAGLRPAGDDGTYFQRVPMHEVAITPTGTRFTQVRPDGSTTDFAFLHEITVVPADDLPTRMEGALTFRGYCGRETMDDIAGRIVVCFGTQRAGLPGSAERAAQARAGHALGLVNIDDPAFTLEPPRWPSAYARSVTLDTGPGAAGATPQAPLVVMRLSASAAARLFAGSGHDAASLVELGGAQRPLPNVDLAGTLRVRLAIARRDLDSPNVLAVLPGADPSLATEHVVVSAHLDGYGHGTPVGGDALYNGTLDDAAYVALLIQMADDIHRHALPHPKRSLLFAAFTGEEKGLLGSTWFVAHPTLPPAQLAADVNLDQLRPLFPLRILTAEALTDSTLGDTARAVAAARHIELRPDTEPERNLLHRADQYPFLMAHIPAISFIFGYDPGTDAEARYREWYRVRYHRPQDDLTQPVDFTAAADFDAFFYALVEAIADTTPRPTIAPDSAFAAPRLH